MEKSAYEILSDVCSSITEKMEGTDVVLDGIDICADVSLDGRRIITPQSEECVTVRLIVRPHRAKA